MMILILNDITTVEKLSAIRAEILLENLRLRRRMEQVGYNPVMYSETILNNERSLEIIREQIQAILN